MMGLQDIGAADEIALLASTVRGVHLEELPPEGELHPVHNLLLSLTALMEQCSSTWPKSELVANRLCELYLNGSRQVQPMREAAATVILGLLPRHPAVCLDAMAELLQSFEGQEGEGAALSALSKSTEAMMRLSQEGGGIQSAPDAARAALQLVRQLIRETPGAVLSSQCREALHAHLGLAIESVKNPHPDSTRAAVLLLKEL